MGSGICQTSANGSQVTISSRVTNLHSTLPTLQQLINEYPVAAEQASGSGDLREP